MNQQTQLISRLTISTTIKQFISVLRKDFKFYHYKFFIIQSLGLNTSRIFHRSQNTFKVFEGRTAKLFASDEKRDTAKFNEIALGRFSRRMANR